MKRNQISKLPREFFYFESLEEIDLSENNLTYIPSFVFKLQNLKKANLNINKIKDFEIMEDENNKFVFPIEHRFHIEYLFLARNLIEVLPYDLIMNDNLDRIEHLTLDENPIIKPSKELLIKIEKDYKDRITFKYNNEIDKKEEEEELQKQQTESYLVTAKKGGFNFKKF